MPRDFKSFKGKTGGKDFLRFLNFLNFDIDICLGEEKNGVIGGVYSIVERITIRGLYLGIIPV